MIKPVAFRSFHRIILFLVRDLHMQQNSDSVIATIRYRSTRQVNIWLLNMMIVWMLCRLFDFRYKYCGSVGRKPHRELQTLHCVYRCREECRFCMQKTVFSPLHSYPRVLFGQPMRQSIRIETCLHSNIFTWGTSHWSGCWRKAHLFVQCHYRRFSKYDYFLQYSAVVI